MLTCDWCKRALRQTAKGEWGMLIQPCNHRVHQSCFKQNAELYGWDCPLCKDDLRSEDSQSAGSLEEFIVHDDDGEDINGGCSSDDKEDLAESPTIDGIDPSNIIAEGKRQRRAPQRYVDENYVKLMIENNSESASSTMVDDEDDGAQPVETCDDDDDDEDVEEDSYHEDADDESYHEDADDENSDSGSEETDEECSEESTSSQS